MLAAKKYKEIEYSYLYGLLQVIIIIPLSLYNGYE